MRIHDSHDVGAEDRFTAHFSFREDVASVSVIEIDLETYGPTEDAARARMKNAMRELAASLTKLSDQ